MVLRVETFDLIGCLSPLLLIQNKDAYSTHLHKPMPLLVLVRHGQSSWNLENRFTGEVDVDLTPLGRVEARAAGEKLKGISFSHGFHSMHELPIETLSLTLEVRAHQD